MSKHSTSRRRYRRGGGQGIRQMTFLLLFWDYLVSLGIFGFAHSILSNTFFGRFGSLTAPLSADGVRTSSSSSPFLQLSTRVWGVFHNLKVSSFQPHENHMLPVPRTTGLHTTRSAPRQDLHTYTSIFVRLFFMLFLVSRLFNKVEKGI
jgi:hypothetical protein